MQLGLIHGVEGPKLQPMAGRPQQALERGRRGVRARALEPGDLGLAQARPLAELRLGEVCAATSRAQERRGSHVIINDIAFMPYGMNVILRF